MLVLLTSLLGLVSVTSIGLESSDKECTGYFQEINRHCVFIDPTRYATYSEASYFCSAIESTLLKVDSVAFHSDIVQFIQNEDLTHLSYWIGGSKNETSGDWIWSDGTSIALDSVQWAQVLPVEDDSPEREPQGNQDSCLTLDSERFFYFDNNDCSNEFHFICEYV